MYNKAKGDIMNENTIKNILDKLSKSTFRSRFILKENELKYINDKGLKTIENHANDFISKRLAPKEIPNDGKQTPMKGHPVFIAQHATATCCRSCLYKWHKIKSNKELTPTEQKYIVNVIMEWIKVQMNK